ncbi:hypothetical protein LTR85_004822 [Meristemomyces frigidus]|nr:hypothetical protein LTR85_004822 [Meristemomyces frigidus]
MSQKSTISRKSRKGKLGARPATSAVRPAKLAKSRGHHIISADPRSAGFCDLPGELRNHIYAFALTLDDGGPIRLNAGSGTSQRLALSLLATCKAAHREAIGILYRQNQFQVDVRDSKYDVMPQRLAQILQATDRKVMNAEMKEWVKDSFRPGLATTLGLMPAKYIAMVRTWIFAYHAIAEGRCTDCTTRAWRTQPADLVLQLELLPIPPFFSLAVIKRTPDRTAGAGSTTQSLI